MMNIPRRERLIAALDVPDAAQARAYAERSILEAAAREKGDLKVLAVTVLTSFDQRNIAELGYAGTVEDLVLQRARAALESGCDGVIASGLDAPRIKAAFGARLLVVTPGVRPAGAPAQDQKRVVDVAQAFANGADYIVVGRPIRDAPDPRAAALAIQAGIASAFNS